MSVADRRTNPSDAPAPVDEPSPDNPPSHVRPLIPLLAVPHLAVRAEGLRGLALDARGAYLLSLVDDHCSVATILEVCEPELTQDDALQLLAHLRRVGAIDLREP